MTELSRERLPPPLTVIARSISDEATQNRGKETGMGTRRCIDGTTCTNFAIFFGKQRQNGESTATQILPCMPMPHASLANGIAGVWVAAKPAASRNDKKGYCRALVGGRRNGGKMQGKSTAVPRSLLPPPPPVIARSVSDEANQNRGKETGMGTWRCIDGTTCTNLAIFCGEQRRYGERSAPPLFHQYNAGCFPRQRYCRSLVCREACGFSQ